MAGRHRRGAALDSRRRAAPVTTAPHPPLAIEMTDGPTHVTHHVTEQAMAEGRRAGGRYRALCGARVSSASLTAPVQRRCPTCTVRASS